MNKVGWILFAGLLIAGEVMAQSKPFNASLTPDLSVYGREPMINGLTLSLWGENQQNSLALGFVNGTTGNSTGLSLGLLNYAEDYKGVQWGFVNSTTGDFTGWQGGFAFGLLVGAVNYTGGTMKGFQSGIVNYAGSLTGLQLGLINYAQRVDSGVQIGLLNIMPENQWFDAFPEEVAPGMIFVNWSF